MLGLPYPGGPHIAARGNVAEQCGTNAEKCRNEIAATDDKFQRPSFFFLWTQNRSSLSSPQPLKNILVFCKNTRIVQSIAHEFQEAVVDVLVAKTIKAAQTYKARAILLGGGVAAMSICARGLPRKSRAPSQIPHSFFRINQPPPTTPP